MPIVVVGDGPDLQRLRARYGDTATFTGRLDDRDLAELYSRAAALVVPNVEEFGIVAVEAMAAGRPVVAINAGGTQETVVHGETGLLVDQQTPQAFAAALRELPTAGFDCTAIARHAQRFSRQRFQREMSEFVEAAVSGRVAATVPAAIAC
jgi:glycosyltransferase involved in cell wall biosynthesis